MQLEHSVEIGRFLERFGQLTAGLGMGPEAGRLVGWLLIAEPACQTAAEVAQGTGLELAQATGMLEGLAAWQLLDRVPLRGDRTCYAVKSLDEIVHMRMVFLGDLRQILDEGLGWLEGDARTRVAELSRFYALVETQMPEILKQVQASRAG
jgi:hypothetical protein